MKLYYTEKSPYARLVRAVAHLRGVGLELVNPGHPSQDPEALLAANPLGKIPCLQTPDGTWLLDSRVILAYLDTQSMRPPTLLPHSMAEHNLLALGYGVLDAAVNIALETMRAEPGDDYIARQGGKISRALAHLEKQTLPQSPTAASLSVAVAYDYLSFRMPLMQALVADKHYPTLDAWVQTMRALPCMQATYPKD